MIQPDVQFGRNSAELSSDFIIDLTPNALHSDNDSSLYHGTEAAKLTTVMMSGLQDIL